VSLSADADRRIRSLRPSKPLVDPFKAHGSVLETERRPDGRSESTVTAFLAGAECPFACSFCDLWRWTIDGPTPPGALTTQLRIVLDQLERPLPSRLKIYNASNFFDRRAVPEQDLASITRIAADFASLTVESHASTIGAPTLDFANAIDARLEVALGLETIHPLASARTNKRLELDRFDSAASFLVDNDIDLRVFVLLGVPFVPAEESVEWTLRSVEHAVERGASVISVIPVRGGNGELERLQSLGHFTPPTFAQLEEVATACCAISRSVVRVDLWDVDLLEACPDCRVARVQGLRGFNLSGRYEPMVDCGTCHLA
jgi:archaeosine synthase beta-subunit